MSNLVVKKFKIIINNQYEYSCTFVATSFSKFKHKYTDKFDITKLFITFYMNFYKCMSYFYENPMISFFIFM